MLGVYNYTVILTYLGMLAGFTGITCAFGGQVQQALLCLMAAGFCDMFDGKVASTKKGRTDSEKRFGIQIDSLSDLICFGALPGVIVFANSQGSRLSYGAAGVYLLCALIRLAWFNVNEEERQNQETGTRTAYLGLPVTSAALILPILLGLGRCRGWNMEYAGPVALLVTAAAFLTPFPLKKPALVGKVLLLIAGAAGATLLILGG